MTYKKRVSSALLTLIMTCTSIPIASVYSADVSNETLVYEFLTENMGLNSAAASGVLANIDQESAFIPTAYCIDTNNLISYGICQWNGSRYEALKSFCEQNGYAYDSLSGQLAYLQYELQTNYIGCYDYLLNSVENSAQGAYDSAYFWASSYEVCNSIYWEGRASLARDVYWSEYETYTTIVSTPVDIGTNFYSEILNYNSEQAINFNDIESKIYCSVGDKNQIWRLERQEDGAYRILNPEGSKALTAGNNVSFEPALSNSNQLWYLYEGSEGYNICPKTDISSCLTVEDNNSVSLKADNGEPSQIFIFKNLEAPGSVEVKAEAGTAFKDTYISWNKNEKAQGYNLKIWKGDTDSGEHVFNYSGLTECSVSLKLASGTYSAVVESYNYAGITESKKVSFTVQERRISDFGDDFFAKIKVDDSELLTSDNSSLSVEQENKTNSQLWHFQKQENGEYIISNVLTGKELSTSGEDNSSSNKFKLYGVQNDVIFADSNQYVMKKSENDKSVYFAECGDKLLNKISIIPYKIDKPELHIYESGSSVEASKFVWDEIDCADSYILKISNKAGTFVAEKNFKTNDVSVQLEAGEYTVSVIAKNKATSQSSESNSIDFVVRKVQRSQL